MSDWPPPQDPNSTPGPSAVPPPQYPPPGQYPPAGAPPQYPPPAQYPPAGQYPPGGQYPPVPPPGYGAYPTPGYPPAGGSAYGAPPFAGFFSRLGARLIDAIIVAIPFGVAYGALLALPHSSRIVSCTKNGVQGYCHPPGSGAVAAAVIIGLLGLVFALWYQIFLLGKTGQTWGCKAVDIKVVDRATGTPIGAGRAFGRLLVSIVSGWLCYLGYLWMLWDGEKQTWHDKAASAYVIRA